ncbi:transmembrane protein [Citrus sinensis]|uniref:Transmembrane protein n=1 Tax=Citrus sinensis TaxID=2711 RepID=A0ACB8IEH8_CITSI|nr:transmembrane protein [Citrus sinensis]
MGGTFKPIPQPRLEVPARTGRHRFSQQRRLPCDSNWGANSVKTLKGTPLPVEPTLCWLVDKDPNDPIFKMNWIIPFLMRDFLKLENQIPFRVLQSLFDILALNSGISFAWLTLKFFSYMLERSASVLDKASTFDGKHLLDLVRLSFCPTDNRERPRDEKRDTFLRFIQPAEKLHRAGIKFKTRNNKDSFLDIKFTNGVLRIPPLPMDDFISSFFLNCVAFEQCYGHCPKYITDYTTFLGGLIHTPTDAGFLSDHKIIENFFGTDEEVACFFTNVGKDVAFEIRRSYLSKLIEDVNEYYWNDWHVRWASLRHMYFDSPWSGISVLAAIFLLILTTIQAAFAVISYIRPSNNN